MSSEKYEGIREALEYAMLTDQSVNVALNRDESVKVEGVIKKICEDSFKILSEETGVLEKIKISEVEYVEYS